MMKAPAFWYDDESHWQARLLAPFSLAWRLGGRVRALCSPKASLPGPCLCIGNTVVGGSGKTPVVQILARLLHQAGRKPAVVLAGYGGKLAGPLRVDPKTHDTAGVGDEALLHASLVPTFVAHDRVAGARAAFAAGNDIVLFDDGLQNPALQGAKKILVIDGETGIGNGKVMPAGPLREPLAQAMARADIVLILDDDRQNLATNPALTGRMLLRARRTVLVPPELYFKPVVAFCGIAHPRGFFVNLVRKGLQLAATTSFADHHVFTEAELDKLWAQAASKGAQLVTTAKDWVRLSSVRRTACTVIALDLEMPDRDLAALRDWALAEPTPK